MHYYFWEGCTENVLFLNVLYLIIMSQRVLNIGVSSRQFRKSAEPCLPFHGINNILVAAHSKNSTLLCPIVKKRCLFIIFVYILNILYIFKFKNAFRNQKCALNSIKIALFLFSAPCPFLNLRENSENMFY